MTTYTLDVTAEDIAKGIKGSAEHCPIALAFVRQYPEFRDPLRLMRTLILTHEMRAFAYKFDRNESVEPTTFTFDDYNLGFGLGDRPQ